MSDDDLYQEVIDKFEIVETMIDNEYSRRDETGDLLESINKLYARLKQMRHHLAWEYPPKPPEDDR